MEQIRNVTQLIEGNVQEYALFEVNRTQQQYQAMQIGLTRWAIGGLGMILAAILFSIVGRLADHEKHLCADQEAARCHHHDRAPRH